MINSKSLAAWPIAYRYRYCDRCRREWPAERTQCPECLLRLGATPLERTGWQLAPRLEESRTPDCYEHNGVAASNLRLIGPRPTDCFLHEATAHLRLLFQPLATACEVTGVNREEWLLSSRQDAQEAFHKAVRLRDRLIDRLFLLQRIAPAAARLRWGM